MGNFYATWLQCTLRLRKIEKNYFVEILLNAICNREILRNKSLLASNFSDAKYKNLLCKDKKDITMVRLINLWKKIRETELR